MIDRCTEQMGRTLGLSEIQLASPDSLGGVPDQHIQEALKI